MKVTRKAFEKREYMGKTLKMSFDESRDMVSDICISIISNHWSSSALFISKKQVKELMQLLSKFLEDEK